MPTQHRFLKPLKQTTVTISKPKSHAKEQTQANQRDKKKHITDKNCYSENKKMNKISNKLHKNNEEINKRRPQFKPPTQTTGSQEYSGKPPEEATRIAMVTSHQGQEPRMEANEGSHPRKPTREATENFVRFWVPSRSFYFVSFADSGPRAADRNHRPKPTKKTPDGSQQGSPTTEATDGSQRWKPKMEATEGNHGRFL